jgi:hypothetical protein
LLIFGIGTGITIDFKAVPANAKSSIRSTLDPLSKVTNSSAKQFAKLDLHKTATLAGISISRKRLPENAPSSILSSAEPFSNTTFSSRAQFEKLA